MKQFQFEYININNFRRELARIKRFCDKVAGARPVFQFFTQVSAFDELKDMLAIIEVDFPDSFYYGCQSFGNIIDGNLAKDKTLVVCSVWEYESTKVEAIYIDPTDENARFRTLEDVWEYSNSLGCVKAIEIISTYHASELLKVGEAKVSLPPEVKVFGAIAINPTDITSADSFLFSKTDGVSDKTAIAFLLGGEDLSIDCFDCTGWQGLGKSFRITKCKGKVIHEIDNEPAAEIYSKYLGIQYGEDFVRKALRFPLLVETNGMECIRIPMPTKNENDIELTVAPKQGASVRFAFGETSKILEAINANVKQIFDFAPETIRIYSCATRRQFWGDDKISMETSMLDGIAATVGFYTRGELMRVGDYLQYFNATIITCLVREGIAVESNYQLEDLIEKQSVYQETSKSLLQYVEEISREIESYHNRTMAGIARTYSDMLEIDLVQDTFVILDKDSNLSPLISDKASACKNVNYLVETCIMPEYTALAYKFFDLSTLNERLKKKSFIDEQFIGRREGWFRAQFIAISYSEDGSLEKVILTIQSIDKEKRTEETLRRMSYTDEQTGLSNRNRYELDVREFSKKNLRDSFVYICMDVNGLKTVNDSLGHTAGDELICGAATCFKNAVGNYGKVYRIGGDEFIAMIYASEKQLHFILEEFEKNRREWHGIYIDKISVSIGIVSKKEFPNITFDEIEQLADERMYEQKMRYYSETKI